MDPSFTHLQIFNKIQSHQSLMSLAGWFLRFSKMRTGDNGLRREENVVGRSEQTLGRPWPLTKSLGAPHRPSSTWSRGSSLDDLVYSKSTRNTLPRRRKWTEELRGRRQRMRRSPWSRLQTTCATALAGKILLADSLKSPGIESTIFVCICT